MLVRFNVFSVLSHATACISLSIRWKLLLALARALIVFVLLCAPVWVCDVFLGKCFEINSNKIWMCKCAPIFRLSLDVAFVRNCAASMAFMLRTRDDWRFANLPKSRIDPGSALEIAFPAHWIAGLFATFFFSAATCCSYFIIPLLILSHSLLSFNMVGFFPHLFVGSFITWKTFNRR